MDPLLFRSAGSAPVALPKRDQHDREEGQREDFIAVPVQTPMKRSRFLRERRVYAAFVSGAVFVLAGNFWCDNMEAIRLGNGHASYRDRIPWHHHFVAEYVVGVVLFWVVAIAIRRRTAASESSFSTASDEQV